MNRHSSELLLLRLLRERFGLEAFFMKDSYISASYVVDKRDGEAVLIIHDDDDLVNVGSLVELVGVNYSHV